MKKILLCFIVLAFATVQCTKGDETREIDTSEMDWYVGSYNLNGTHTQTGPKYIDHESGGWSIDGDTTITRLVSNNLLTITPSENYDSLIVEGVIDANYKRTLVLALENDNGEMNFSIGGENSYFKDYIMGEIRKEEDVIFMDYEWIFNDNYSGVKRNGIVQVSGQKIE